MREARCLRFGGGAVVWCFVKGLRLLVVTERSRPFAREAWARREPEQHAPTTGAKRGARSPEDSPHSGTTHSPLRSALPGWRRLGFGAAG